MTTSNRQNTYSCVLAIGQNHERQLSDSNIMFDMVYADVFSEKENVYPQLQKMLSEIQEGDTIHVFSMACLAKSLSHLEEVVKLILGKGAKIVFHEEGMTISGNTSNEMSKTFLQMLEIFVEAKRNMARERQKEGIAIAKEKGLYKGRKVRIDKQKLRSEILQLPPELSLQAKAEHCEVSKSRLYREVKEMREEGLIAV